MTTNRQILHVTTSESFMGFTAEVFEETAPGDNVFVGVDTDLERLRDSDALRIERVSSKREGMKKLERLISQSRVVIFHNVGSSVAEALAKAPSSVLRVWSGWGTDYYGSTLDGNSGLLGPLTRRLVNRDLRPTFWAGRFVHKIRFDKLFHAAARSADVFSAPIPNDLKVFRHRFPGFSGRYSQLNYGSVEDSLATGPESPVGNDILVGNSSAPINNHLEVLNYIATLELEDRRVVVPLSYGDRFYAESVLPECRNLLGERFVPLTDFMSIDEYNDVLVRCGVVIMGHRRQAGLGNILRAIWQGSHVFLDERNPVFQYLRERGVNVAVLEDLAVGLPSESLPLSEVEANRKFLDAYWSRLTAIKNVRTLLDLAQAL